MVRATLAQFHSSRTSRLVKIPTTGAVIAVVILSIESQNVAAVLPGNGPVLKGEYVVFSAHLDHFGIGKPVDGDSIYNGAIDDASGVAAMLDVAAMLKESGTKLRRSVLFVAVTGEEKGLLGSRSVPSETRSSFLLSADRSRG
jgi:Zn-dependent M28 family amino/carboxypeptidase